jgi:Fe-S cluster assembly protein SufD
MKVEKNLLIDCNEIVIKGGEHNKLFERGKSHNSKKNYTIIIEKNASLNFYYDIDSKDIKEALLYTFILKENAKLSISAIANFSKRDNAVIKFQILHKGDKSNSKIKMRGVVRDEASLNITGSVVIEKDAKNAVTDIEERTLSLSESAQITLVPELSINENTSKARHAATIHEVEKNELLYMTSRGFERKKAEEILVDGFLQKELVKWPEETLV